MTSRVHQFLCGCLLLATALPLSATRAAAVRVDYYQQAFYLNLHFRSRLAPQALLDRLTDYENLHRINSGIVQSKIIGHGEAGKVIVWKRLRGCVAFICRELEHTELVDRHGNDISMVTLPEKSDFDMGNAHWLITPIKGMPGATLRYNAMLRPSFSLPPLLGPWLMKRAIVNELRETASALGDIEASAE